MIKLLRIDHRLLHGQVAFSWTADIKANAILIANDDIMKNEVRKLAISIAKPPSVKLVIKSIEDSIKAINSGITDKYNLFIIVESVKDAYRLIMECTQINSLNLGGIPPKEDSIKLGNVVYCTPEEIVLLDELGLPLALQGNILGPLLYFLIYNIPAFWLRFFGVRKGYELGVSYLATFKESGLMDKLMKAANILGVMVIGCMTIEMVYTSFSLPIGSVETATLFKSCLMALCQVWLVLVLHGYIII